MLHILNGDSTATSFFQSAIPRDQVIVWREILFEGPLVTYHTPVEFWQARQHYISRTYEENAETYIEKVTAEVKALEKFSQHAEVVLWFEHDLLCQVNLLYLLHWFARQNVGSVTLSLVCIGTHPEKPDFKGLGELSSGQLAALFPQRQVLTPADLAHGDRGWQAYASADPRGILAYLQEDFSRLPLIKPALEAHLTRFPSVQNGLNAIEQVLLTIIAESQPATLVLFEQFWQRAPIFGLGDAQIANYLKELAQAGLVHLADHITLTTPGQQVLHATTDNALLKRPDYWVGGVHLQPDQPIWRWDAGLHQLVSE